MGIHAAISNAQGTPMMKNNLIAILKLKSFEL